MIVKVNNGIRYRAVYKDKTTGIEAEYTHVREEVAKRIAKQKLQAAIEWYNEKG